jgi:hypothetical protein
MAHQEVMVVAADLDRATANKEQARRRRKNPMNGTFIKVSILAIAFSVSIAASSAYSQGKGKAKGKQNIETTDEKHGRQAGELPYGLDQFSEKKGELPSGLQKKKDDDGSLTHGLEDGGKRVKPTGTTSKGRKS